MQIYDLGFRPHSASGAHQSYLWPEKPTFLGFPIMVSIYNFLKGSVLGGQR